MQTRSGKIGYTGENVGEPRLGIDVVEPTGGDHRQHDGGPVSSALGASEGPIAAPEGYSAQGSFGGVVKGYDAFGAGFWLAFTACEGHE